MVKNLPATAGDAGSIPGLGSSPGGGHGSPLQSSCPENPIDKGAWQATVQGVAESDTTERLSTQKLQAQGLFPSPLVQTASPGTSPRQSRLQERGSRTRGSAAASGFCYIGFPPVEGEGI